MDTNGGKKRSALLVGDAVVSTGFARANHAYVDGLIAAGWDVSMLGMNYMGDPHSYPYPIYSCYSHKAGGDPFGVRRTGELVDRLRPDIVCLTTDPWNVPEYLKRVGNTPMFGAIAVDGKNCRGTDLNGLAGVVFWTQFGLEEARLGGYAGPAWVVPLGVDLTRYSLGNFLEARKRMRLPKACVDGFIVGVVGRNQPRKRLDLTLMYFAEWVKSRNIQDAFLFLHVAPTGDTGYDLKQLGQYLRISNRLIVSDPEVGQGVTEANLARLYSTFNVMLTTTQGEGWGLPHLEAMACGVPTICPDWAALGEWPNDDASIKVPCSSVACTINNINAIGGIPDKRATLEALDSVYTDRAYLHDLSESGLQQVQDPRFRWDHIGKQYALAVESTLEPRKFVTDAPLVEAEL